MPALLSTFTSHFNDWIVSSGRLIDCLDKTFGACIPRTDAAATRRLEKAIASGELTTEGCGGGSTGALAVAAAALGLTPPRLAGRCPGDNDAAGASPAGTLPGVVVVAVAALAFPAAAVAAVDS